MEYYTDLFTPETWEAFRKHGATVSGFRERQKKSAERIKRNDLLICYLVRLSRWCGLLRVVSGPYIDNTPIFDDPDPFVVRFNVEPLVVLDVEKGVPIFEDRVWSSLLLTRDIPNRAPSWAQSANLRASLRQLGSEDGKFLSELMLSQGQKLEAFALTPEDKRRLTHTGIVRTTERSVSVEVPAEEVVESTEGDHAEVGDAVRESHKIQASLATIGATMGFKIWLPRADKQRVLELITVDARQACLDVLPLNYNDATLKTIEQIDVLWLKNRSMARAFEVEHTTAIYSGLLRMADLLALQPNMRIHLHIVAPLEKREKVLREIRRPVFSLLESGPLYENCTYLSYGAVEELASQKHLEYMNDAILEEYEESAEDV